MNTTKFFLSNFQQLVAVLRHHLLPARPHPYSDQQADVRRLGRHVLGPQGVLLLPDHGNRVVRFRPARGPRQGSADRSHGELFRIAYTLYYAFTRSSLRTSRFCPERVPW